MFPTFSKKFLRKKEAVTMPSGSMSGAAPPAPKKRDMRFIASVTLFVLTLLMTGGMYGANLYFDSRIAYIEEGIIRQEESLQPEVIRRLDSFNKQVRILQDLSTVRGGYVPLLYELGRLVVPGARYTSANISLTSDGRYQVSARGTADSLITYLQQVSVIDNIEGVLADISFTGYTIRRLEGGGNNVDFTLEAEIDPSALLQSDQQSV